MPDSLDKASATQTSPTVVGRIVEYVGKGAVGLYLAVGVFAGLKYADWIRQHKMWSVFIGLAGLIVTTMIYFGSKFWKEELENPAKDPADQRMSEPAIRHQSKFIAFVNRHPVLSILAGSLLVFLLLWKLPDEQVEQYRRELEMKEAYQKVEPKERLQLEKDLIDAKNTSRTTLAQILGGVALLLGLYFTARNVQAAHENVRISQQNMRIAQENLRVTEEGKLTDRFSKAVEMLGSDKLDVRLGGIYALERLACDSQHDHWTVMEVLTAFIREHAKFQPESGTTTTSASPLYESATPSDSEIARLMRALVQEFKATTTKAIAPASDQPKSEKIATDIQAALTVIGRRKWRDKERPHQRLDLRLTYLRGAALNGAHLERAFLNGVYLEKATLSYAHLEEAILIDAHLERAFLIGAHLEGACLIDAHLEGAILGKAHLKGTPLAGAHLDRTVFYSDVSEESSAIGLTWEQLSKAAFDGTPILPPDLARLWEAEWQKRYAGQQQAAPPAESSDDSTRAESAEAGKE